MSTNWKRRELKLQNGYADLALSVVRQWKVDGKPRCSAAGAEAWAHIALQYQKMCSRT